MANIDDLPSPQDDWAFFLDVDGTLVEIAPTPSAVVAGGETIAILKTLARRFDGAVALVSGRPIADLDRLFAPLRLPAAGVHGMERRTAAGGLVHACVPTNGLAAARDALRTAERDWPGVLVEDKGGSIAVHYRLAPEREAEVLTKARAIAAAAEGNLLLLTGKMVVELRPPGPNKGDVVAAFLDEAPFAGRTPLFIGDDVTDEDGFKAVNRLGGHSIRIGTPGGSAARHALRSTEALRGWLRAVAGAAA